MRTLLVTALVLSLAPAPRAAAWNNTGHKTVALLAYRDPKLSDGQRARIVAILKEHPHIDRFLLTDRPADVDMGEWIVVQAATWPDWVRPRRPPFQTPRPDEAEINKFHLGDWHFLNTPFFLPADAAEVNKAKIKAKDKNILKGLAENSEKLRAQDTLAKDRAIALCWLLHLLGDVHQPLHSSLLFSTQFPPPNGDEGGNLFLVVRGQGHFGTKLHAFWDDLLGETDTFTAIDKHAAEISRDKTLTREALKKQLALPGFKAWADESFELAKSVVYKNGELTGAGGIHTHDDGPFIIPHLPDGYEAKAKDVARERIALAGYRLAEQLTTILEAK